MLQVFADALDEEAVAVAVVLLGGGWWKRPVLAVGRKIVGRRAHSAASRVKAAMCPQIGARAVGRESEIVIQTDRHPEFYGTVMRTGKLLVSNPLQVFEK